VICGAAIIFSALGSRAQDSPTFQVGTKLVQVDVIVRDAKGPVRDLKKEDFTLFDKGKPQKIEVFSIRTTPAQPPPPSRQAPGVVSNRPAGRATDPVAGTVILFDRLNTQVEDQAFARLQALKYLQKANRNEEIAVFSLNKTVRVVQGFTSDHDLLVKAVDKATIETSVDLTADQLVQDLPVTGNAIADAMTKNAAALMLDNARQRRADTTSSAFATIARHLKGIPGRKKLIWISSSLPNMNFDVRQHNGSDTIEFQDLSEQLDAPGKMLNDANVVLYYIDPIAVLGGVTRDELTVPLHLTAETGGKAVYADNDIASILEEVMDDTDVTYTLGFYPSHCFAVREAAQAEGSPQRGSARECSADQADDSFHSLKVKVNRRGLEVRHRMGYQEETHPPLTEKQRGPTLTKWADEPLEATFIPINALARPVEGKPGFYKVDVGINVTGIQLDQNAGHWTGLVEIAILHGDGKKTKGLHQSLKLNLTQAHMEMLLKQGMIVSNVVQVTDPKGKLYANNLHVIVMDGTTGYAGSVRVPVKLN
jgi:VWFA-related protein